jgi:hypothetical protein
VATRKQRRRREKEHRHEYVWQDAEGNEVDPVEARARTNGADTRSGAKAASSPRRNGADGGRGGGRQVQPPSWGRTFKRALIFAPIFLATVMLLNRGLTFAGAVLNTAFLLAVFVPFSYLIDRVMYRTFQKRQERASGPPATGKR